jgi:hypothetical protein
MIFILPIHRFSAPYVECGIESFQLLIPHGANSFIQYFIRQLTDHQSASWRTNWWCCNNEPQPEKPLNPALHLYFVVFSYFLN